MSLPQRKRLRLEQFDYSSEAYYFLTVCTHGKKHLFGLPERHTVLGELADKQIKHIPLHFPDVTIDKYVIMPNHIHMIISIGCADAERSRPFPTVSTVVGLFKSGVSKSAHQQYPDLKLWQTSYYDHVVRNQKDYDETWTYIENNPARWAEDEYYCEESR